MIPGMPNLVFLLLASGWVIWPGGSSARRPPAARRRRSGGAQPAAGGKQEASWADVAPVDVLGWKSAIA
jgi:flagellar biosynthesis protein FlhA